MKKIFAFAAVIAAASLALGGCAAKDGEYSPGYGEHFEFTSDAEGSYVHGDVIEQDFKDVAEEASSYFSLDRNTATYSLVRRQIQSGYKVSESAVRVEEMINYFDYDFPAPEEEAVALSASLSGCPWNSENKLISIGLKTKEYVTDANANYVFLIDVSGSMEGADRLGLAKKGLNMLLDGLSERDAVSIVTYASGVKTVLDGAECSESGKAEIKDAILKLNAYGATSGGDGLERAYSVAQKHFIEGGNNRVIIISDGDFNVGMSSVDELKEFIQEKAKSDIYL